MQYVKLGGTGMDVSRICLGCMSFGDADKGFAKWALNEQDSRAIIKRAIELGINFFDTANVYSYGTSEEYLGRALKDYAKRDEIVVATKVFTKMKDAPNSSGLSRKTIMHELDNSLQRLGMDYVDLYIAHRWDYDTPIEETLAAFGDCVSSGKVRYIGASAMFAWQFQKALYTAEKYHYPKFVSMQNHYNLIYREEEREMVPLCEEYKIATTPYSPLASGRLSRGGTSQDTHRTKLDQIQINKYGDTEEEDSIIIDRVGEIAEARGITRTQVSLAWMLAKPTVASPVIGATKIAHLEDSAASVEVTLSAEEMNFLEENYVPHKVVGAKTQDPNWIHGREVKR